MWQIRHWSQLAGMAVHQVFALQLNEQWIEYKINNNFILLPFVFSSENGVSNYRSDNPILLHTSLAYSDETRRTIGLD